MAENMKLGELVSREETRIEKKSYGALLLDVSELKTAELFRACLAEFIATAFFLYFTVGVVCTNTSIGGDPTAGVGIYGVAAAFGASIFVLVYATAGFSGGHINPAVTWAMLLSGRFTLLRTAAYTISQLGGATLGVALVRALSHTAFDAHNGGANFMQGGYTKGAGFLAELVGTTLLVFTVFAATDPTSRKSGSETPHVPALAPAAIGTAVFLAHLVTIPITGTGINPARSFGSAIILNDSKVWDQHWIFWLGPLAGSVVGTILYEQGLKGKVYRLLLEPLATPTSPTHCSDEKV